MAAAHPRLELFLIRVVHLSRLARRRDSKFVTSYLKGLKGIEIGASSHNRYWLDAINVDRYGGKDTVYKREERRLALHTVAVDVVAPGDDLPFADDSQDFVFSSHVIEHFPDHPRSPYGVAKAYGHVVSVCGTSSTLPNIYELEAW